MAFELSRETDSVMKMACSANIQACFDRPELIVSARTSEELPKTGEVGVGRGISRGTGGVDIVAAVVGVPQLDQRAVDGIAAGVQDAAGNVADQARCRREAVIEINQV